MATIDLANINFCPGGSSVNIEPEVNVEFTENNTYSVYPSTGYDAVERVNVNVNIPDNDQTLHYIYADADNNGNIPLIPTTKLLRELTGNTISLAKMSNYVKGLGPSHKGESILLSVIGNDEYKKFSSADFEKFRIETVNAKDAIEWSQLKMSGSDVTPIILPITKMNTINSINVPANISGVIGVDTTNIEEVKTVDITANGTYNVLPANGLLKQVNVNVKTPQLAEATLDVTNINPDKNVDGVWEWEISFTGSEEQVLLNTSQLYEAIINAKDQIADFQSYDFQDNMASLTPIVDLKNKFTLFFPFNDLKTTSGGGLYWYYPGSGNLIYGRIVL